MVQTDCLDCLDDPAFCVAQAFVSAKSLDYITLPFPDVLRANQRFIMSSIQQLGYVCHVCTFLIIMSRR